MAQLQRIRHILVIKPSSLGDILHIFPALQILHENYPDAELDFLVNPEFAPVRLTHLYCLNLDFGEGEKLSLRAERITTPGCVGIAHTGSLYALPTPELRRELIGIILRAVSEK